MKTNIIIYLLLFHIISTTALAQNPIDSLPVTYSQLPSDSLLFAALDQYYQQQLIAQLAEFQIQEKSKWLKYIPSISLGYSLGTDKSGNLSNQLRPSVSFSTNVIYQVHNDKQRRQAKIRHLQQTHHLAHQAAKAELQQLLQSYQLLIQDIQFLKQLNEIDGQLYEIATVQFTAADLAPSAYLPKKRAFKQKQYEIFKKEQELENLQQEIIRQAHY